MHKMSRKTCRENCTCNSYVYRLLIHSFSRVLNAMLPACKPNFTEVARAT